ncbi:putative membrane protein [Flavobacterium nitrogenifigens]|uniref:Membrane protein n=2 Tax=Flavobacterium TaxID=237 RepID=A0ABR6QK57_9FLAO|nr:MULTISPECIES: hypothetical protein [Flavobacterium]MBB4804655.1 putative membrane protein [Flavobacterium nitrogenifigens]MBB6389614.1 putative membrane protein [Flavobacterium notoginsengisoli]
MKKFLLQVERNCISGALVLLPLLVFFVLLEKVWKFFQNYGEKFAHFLRLDLFLGKYATDIAGGMILLVLIYLSGFLMRLALLRRFTNWVDDKLMIFLPGYEKNKKEAEEKLNKRKKKPSTDVPILLKNGEFWQPAHLIEEDANGNAVIFVPTAPAKDQGQILIVKSTDFKKLSETTLGSLDASIKSLGKGILSFK